MKPTEIKVGKIYLRSFASWAGKDCGYADMEKAA